MDIFLTNSLTRKKEIFIPMRKDFVGVYCCGPTVYSRASIGNFRTYTFADTVVRVLKFNGFNVKFVMNITDVGHLTGDNLGDADLGEDRIEAAARRESRSAWEIAKYYTDIFLEDYKLLNLTKPDFLVKATDHIQEQIELIKRIEAKGLTYRIEDGIYFDTLKYEKIYGKRYGELSTLDRIKEGARVKPRLGKKDPRDFALWKFSNPPGVRQMEWESPWGIGFPGWHIECSAMSMKYLGESFDIHIGGEDLRQTHHPNEIAQAEAATGKLFVKYWLHVTHLKVEGKRMGKSLGNVVTLSDIKEKGVDPLALRYLFMTSHYKDPLNFTWEGLSSADKALKRLRDHVFVIKQASRKALSGEKLKKIDSLRSSFIEKVNDDFNTPEALAVLWKMLKSNIPSEDKYDLLLLFDEVLGFNLASQSLITIPYDVEQLLQLREKLRRKKDFEKADSIREEIEKKGFLVEDTPSGPRLKKL